MRWSAGAKSSAIDFDPNWCGDAGRLAPENAPGASPVTALMPGRYMLLG